MTSLLNKEDDNNKVIQALEKEKLFGAAVDIDPLRNDVKYRSILKEEFNAATAENCMKWGSLQINESEWDFNDADYFYEIIQCNSFECNFWNQHLILFAHVNDLFTENMIPSIRIFDPLRGYMTQIYDQIKMSPHESPIYFSNEINNGDNH